MFITTPAADGIKRPHVGRGALPTHAADGSTIDLGARVARPQVMTRRRLIFLPGAWAAWGQALPSSEARNLSFPLQAIEGTLTPPELFFVRDHFSEPELSLSSWKLRVEGSVARPLELDFADLLEAPTQNIEAALVRRVNSDDEDRTGPVLRKTA